MVAETQSGLQCRAVTLPGGQCRWLLGPALPPGCLPLSASPSLLLAGGQTEQPGKAPDSLVTQQGPGFCLGLRP